MRRDDLLVATPDVLSAFPLLQQSQCARALRVVEDESRSRLFVEREEVELLPELSVVAALGFLESLEVGGKVLLGEPSGAIDALQHRALGIASPVRTGDLHELEGVDLASVREVRPSAKIGEVALRVHRDDLALRQLVDQLLLVRLAVELVVGFQLVELAARKRQLLGDDLAHPTFDRLEVLGREGAVDVEVVVEPVLDGWPYAESRHRKKRGNGFRHHVCGRVAKHLQRFRAAVGQNLDRLTATQHPGNVDRLPVHLTGQRRGRQSRPDRTRDVKDGRALGNRQATTVGQTDLDLDHGFTP